MRACGVHTYSDYLGELDRRPDEIDRLLDTITINVTKFYRNPETWSWLERNLLQALVSGNRRGTGTGSGAQAALRVRNRIPSRWLLARPCAAVGREDWIDDVRIEGYRYRPGSFSSAPAPPVYHDVGSSARHRSCFGGSDTAVRSRPEEVREVDSPFYVAFVGDPPAGPVCGELPASPPVRSHLLPQRGEFISTAGNPGTPDGRLSSTPPWVPGGHLDSGKSGDHFGTDPATSSTCRASRERVYRKPL